MTGKFHPRFKQAHKSHRARTERDVKLPTAPFYVGQELRVVGRDRNTIVVEFFDGRANTITRRLEVCADDQGAPRGGELTEGEEQAFRDGYAAAKGDDDNRERGLSRDQVAQLLEGEGK